MGGVLKIGLWLRSLQGLLWLFMSAAPAIATWAAGFFEDIPWTYRIPLTMLALAGGSILVVGLLSIWEMLGGRRKRARLDLVKLRDEGAALRRRGIRLQNADEVEPWNREIDDWHERTVGVIAKIDPADAGQYRTIDFPGEPRAHLPIYLNDKHLKAYAVLDRLLVTLVEFMTKYGSVK